MGRKHTFSDKEFNTWNYDSDDMGDFEENLVFLIMPFSGKDIDDTYIAIREECENLELKPIRVDENVGSTFIFKEITNLIERAEFIICDLTDERPNVYYELGYAHGVGNESMDILLIAKEGSKVHFDIAPLRISYYKNVDHLKTIIRKSLIKMIKTTRQ